MKNYLCLFFYILIQCNLYSQEGFNKLFLFEQDLVVLADMVLDDDKIVVLGMGISDTIDKQFLYLAKLDTAGNLINFELEYNPNGQDYYFWYRSTLIKTSDGGYAACGTSSGDISVFVKFNHDLELEFIKEFDLEDSNRSYYKKLIEIEDGYIIAGDMQKFDFDHKAFSQKLDFEGNEIWYKTYDEPNYPESIMSLCQLLNGDILVREATPNSRVFIISPIDGSILWEENNLVYLNTTDIITPSIDSGFVRGTY